MNNKLKILTIRTLYVFMPLIAVVALGVSSYVWYKALVPETKPIFPIHLLRVAPHTFSDGLEGNVRAMLTECGIDENVLTIRKADPLQDTVNKIYSVKVPETFSLTLLNLQISTRVRDMGGLVFRGIEGSDGKTLTLTVGVGKTPTDIIIFKKVPGIIAQAAKIAVIIDDLGIKSLDFARRLCNLDQIVTLSVLPFQRHTSEVVDLARETDTPYILHMPMEPKSNKVSPGEGAIFIGDDESEVRKKLAKAFRSVKGAKGLNNHMGSKVTEDVRTMEYVMNYLREQNNFFIDSQTSRNSIGYKISQKSGIKSTLISGYIDVENDKDYIQKRLATLVALALEKESAIILCHDRPNTIEILERKLTELQESGIKFVKVSDLLH